MEEWAAKIRGLAEERRRGDGKRTGAEGEEQVPKNGRGWTAQQAKHG